jgi:hypothetical protein
MPNAINSLISLGQPEFWTMKSRYSKPECLERIGALKEPERTREFMTHARDLIPIPASQRSPRFFQLFRIHKKLVMNVVAHYPPKMRFASSDECFNLWPDASVFPMVVGELTETERGTTLNVRMGRFVYRDRILIAAACALLMLALFVVYYVVTMSLPGVAEGVFTVVLVGIIWFLGKQTQMAWQTRRQVAELIRMSIDADFEDKGWTAPI